MTFNTFTKTYGRVLTPGQLRAWPHSIHSYPQELPPRAAAYRSRLSLRRVRWRVEELEQCVEPG
jgi:hypothetical protein